MNRGINRILEPSPNAHAMDPMPILLTNDDGIDSEGLIALAKALHIKGHPLVVLAPKNEQSACGMKLTLHDNMEFSEHHEVAEQIQRHDSVPLRVFSLDGSPCDCVIVAIDGGLRAWAPEVSPHFCISGINRGPNLSVDVLHSGTVSAAREASLYGLPSMSVSLATYEHEEYSSSVDATMELLGKLTGVICGPPGNLRRPNGSSLPNESGHGIKSVRSWVRDGNLFLNLNIPGEWNGSFQTVPLGARWYFNATDMIPKKREYGVAFEIGAARIEEEDIPMTDCNAVNSGFASITPLASWPRNHPLGVPDEILEASIGMGSDGLPNWL